MTQMRLSPSRGPRLRIGGLWASSLLALSTIWAGTANAETWDPFPVSPLINDFGGVGLLQTPTARMAPDGAISFSANHVAPYERYAITFQALPWLEATLRYSSIGNRLYSDNPAFSGSQTYKDRGFDLKATLVTEGSIRPSVAVGLRDFLGTGIFQSEYIVGNKRFGAFDVSLGLGWGQLGTRAHFGNPLLLISDRFRFRSGFTARGGSIGKSYFKGADVALFGGVRYDTPIPGLSTVIEYDSNNYQSEALDNRFRVSSPINVGVDYRLKPWLHLGASWERGNRLGLHLVLSGNLHDRSRVLKQDPPAPQFTASEPAPSQTPGGTITGVSQPIAPSTKDPAANTAEVGLATTETLGAKVEAALATQGATLISAKLEGNEAVLYVAQGRYREVATGLGRVARAAFSVLPANVEAVRVIFVENGVTTMSVRLYRHLLAGALQRREGSLDELLLRSDFSQAGGIPADINYRASAFEHGPRLFYGIRPALRTTLGRPEQFILYQAWVKLNVLAEFAPGLTASGSFGYNLSNNFSKIRNSSDSTLPHVRSDIDKYLKNTTTSFTHLQADYNFGIAPGLYGHVYGGLLEEMYAGVGGEVLYRPYDRNWALGADLTFVRQRDFNGYFGLQKYKVWTGFVTASYRLPKSNITTTVRAGRYLAKDIGATFDISRTFPSGARVGAFATFTNVSAASFGEGSFDKGIYFSIPLDFIFSKHSRSSIGVLYRPLIRDGGQQLFYRQPLLETTTDMTLENFRQSWPYLDE